MSTWVLVEILTATCPPHWDSHHDASGSCPRVSTGACLFSVFSYLFILRKSDPPNLVQGLRPPTALAPSPAPPALGSPTRPPGPQAPLSPPSLLGSPTRPPGPAGRCPHLPCSTSAWPLRPAHARQQRANAGERARKEPVLLPGNVKLGTFSHSDPTVSRLFHHSSQTVRVTTTADRAPMPMGTKRSPPLQVHTPLPGRRGFFSLLLLCRETCVSPRRQTSPRFPGHHTQANFMCPTYSPGRLSQPHSTPLQRPPPWATGHPPLTQPGLGDARLPKTGTAALGARHTGAHRVTF